MTSEMPFDGFEVEPHCGREPAGEIPSAVEGTKVDWRKRMGVEPINDIRDAIRRF
jgi:hypothetical protein